MDTGGEELRASHARPPWEAGQASAVCHTAARATICETKHMGRKRRARGFLFDSFEHERRRSAPAAWQPWPWVSSS